MRRQAVTITDTSKAGASPYAGYSRQGAVIVPRCLFFVHETENTARIQAAQTVTVNPRRGGAGQGALERPGPNRHHRPDRRKYSPFRCTPGRNCRSLRHPRTPQGNAAPKTWRQSHSVQADGRAASASAGLESRMRGRWQTISGLWETNKTPANQLNLLGQLDYLHKLSSQLEWRRISADNGLRVVYTKSGEPTAALVKDNSALVDHLLYWIPCQNDDEAPYLLAIINSRALATASEPIHNSKLGWQY